MRPTVQMDRVFQALGHTSRREIIVALSRRGACSAGDLVALFDSSQPTISKHLRVMEDAGLIRRSIRGRQHYFEMHAAPLVAAQGWIERHVALWESSFDRLEQLLRDDGGES